MSRRNIRAKHAGMIARHSCPWLRCVEGHMSPSVAKMVGADRHPRKRSLPRQGSRGGKHEMRHGNCMAPRPFNPATFPPSVLERAKASMFWSYLRARICDIASNMTPYIPCTFASNTTIVRKVGADRRRRELLRVHRRRIHARR